jgi:undecaprenyl diphosphate synthase
VNRNTNGKENRDTGGNPRHIAFIMDGNGRWARSRGYRRCHGHENGATALRRITRHCRKLGIPELTFFALSTENYERRPAREVRFLMRLLKSYVVSERPELLDNGIRLKSIGSTEVFPEDVRAEITATEKLTARETGMVLRLALNYGGRREILEATRAVARDVATGRLSLADAQALGEDGFRRYFADADMSDPDLLIRTGGECRLSNFLLWQCSYSEIWVSPALWPDFDIPELDAAIRYYAARERRHGALGGAWQPQPAAAR